MLRGAMVAPMARPNSMARCTAPRFITGREPGKARSTGQACVLGSAPNCVAAPEKIFETVDSCVCVSRPITTSHCLVMCSHSCRCLAMPVGCALERIRNLQHASFVEIAADDLQTDRTLRIRARTEAARHAHAGQTGEAHRQGIDIG